MYIGCQQKKSEYLKNYKILTSKTQHVQYFTMTTLIRGKQHVN